MTITSPNPVSKAWRVPCLLRLRSIPGQPTRCPRPKARSAGEKEEIMSIYAVYEPPLRAHESAPNPERFVFVRDGFSLWAFLLAPFWMLRHRLWLAFVAYVIVALALFVGVRFIADSTALSIVRSEEHTSELQSPDHLVCRLLLEKKNDRKTDSRPDACARRPAA